MPTDLIILYPPIEVPSPMTAEHMIMSHSGIVNITVSVCPPANDVPRRNIAMNF